MKTLKYSKTYLTSIFFILIIALFSGSIAEAASYRINPGQTVTIDRHGECRKVTNPAGRPAIFVPVRTAGEWNAFRLHRPAYIGLAACLPDSYGGWWRCRFRGSTSGRKRANSADTCHRNSWSNFICPRGVERSCIDVSHCRWRGGFRRRYDCHCRHVTCR